MKTQMILVLVGTGAVSFVLSYIGAAAGLILGHLRLPLLVYALGNPIAGASTNLAVSGAGAVAGSYKHVRDRRVSVKVLVLMGLPSALGAVIGVLFFVSINLVWSHVVIGAMLLVSGLELVRASRKKKVEGPAGLPGRWVVPGEIGIGLGLGALAAITGLMLGTMRLPMMIRLLRIDPGVAVGSNMVIGCLTAITAAVTAWAAGGGLHPLSVLIVGPPTILGSYLGARKTGKLSPQSLKRLVGWVVGVTGLFMIGLAVPPLLRRPEAPTPSMEPTAPVEDFPDLRPEAPRPPEEPAWDEPDDT